MIFLSLIDVSLHYGLITGKSMETRKSVEYVECNGVIRINKNLPTALDDETVMDILYSDLQDNGTRPTAQPSLGL